ncbi:hypothetical protein MsAg5_09410 [Methanosarcinaceae archaeon Ag5]|uniref:Uncharacterized protein n=2 Tax=Methanolapillus africanus TaxID=3028297 RepID=A0AAE4SDY6_9EURY|nr:hypothetical protein [Methanosarcinaceae archaeon Ag5]
MENVADSKEYLDTLADIHLHLFIPECGKSEVLRELGSGISILTKDYFYDQDNPKYPYNLEGSHNIVYRNGKEIYSFKTVNNSGYFWLLHHQNGHDYLLFTKDLYGYSVLDLTTLQDFNYFPAGSFPTGETFIWCDIHYNPANNMMAVSGCFWACPSSIVLVDFSNPMAVSPQVDVNEFINQGYERYDDIDFVAWDGLDLILKMNGQTEPVQKEERTIENDTYMVWFENKK